MVVVAGPVTVCEVSLIVLLRFLPDGGGARCRLDGGQRFSEDYGGPVSGPPRPVHAAALLRTRVSGFGLCVSPRTKGNSSVGK